MSRALEALGSRRELAVLAAMLVAVLAFPNRIPGGVAALAILLGAGLALQAIGLILVYQTDGILNFAQLQIGVVGATFFVLFARYTPVLGLVRSACPVCIEDITPSMVRWNYLAGAILGLILSIFVGWLVSTVLVRRLASSPRIVVTVATVFLIPVLGLLQRMMANVLVTQDQRDLSGGAASLSAPGVPVNLSFRWGSVVFGPPHILLGILLIVAGTIVWIFLRRTSSGASLRAVGDNPDRAATLGLDVPRIKSRAWVIASGLSGALGILTAMVAGAPPTTSLGIEAMVVVLAVGLIARMASFSVAVVAALTISLFASALDWSFNAASLLGGVLLLVIGAVLALQRRGTTRAEREREAGSPFGREVRPTPVELRAHPAVRAWMRRGAVLLVAVLAAYPWVMSPSELSLGTAALLAALVGLSILVLTGWAGQLSFGQMAFAAIGAYVAAVTRLPFPAAVLVGALAGSVAALLVGLPALRLRGLHLAVTTLALSVATSAVLLDEHRLGRFLPQTLRRPRFLHLGDDRAFFYLALAILIVAVAAVVALRRSRFARALIAARDNEQGAESFGVGLVRARLSAFAVSGFLAALSGALLAYHQYGVHPGAYGPEQSLNAFLWAIIGGLGSVTGPLLGAAGRAVVDIFSNNQVVQFLAAGLGGLLLLIVAPGGLARIVFGVRDAMLRRLAQRQHIVVPSLLADVGAGERELVTIAPRDATWEMTRYRVDDQWALDAKAPESSRG
jgi:ABC-type branched-subunit amino acid transport system permease subunit